ncbi:MAG: hypothetical protein AABY03_00020 [Nanoarchaeota archaeon]
MAIADVLTVEEIVPEIVVQISQINLWIKGLGVLALGGIIYSIIMLIIERKKMKRLESIEQKIDKILTRKK